MFNQPSSIQFSLPGWLTEYINGVSHLNEVDDRMDFVINASKRNISEMTGGPFAAAIFEIKTGKLISLGVNLVRTEGMSILHAEMVAIAVAQYKLGTYDLGEMGGARHELVTSTEPCAMCFGAIPWSGVRRVISGATDSDARGIGFDEGPKVDDWKASLVERGIEVATEVKRNDARKVLNEYAIQNGMIYNSRGSG